MKSRLLLSLEVIVGLFVSSSSLSAQTNQSLALAWDASSSTNVASYVVRYGTTSGVYSTVTNVGNTTFAQINGLQAGQMYYFIAVAQNTDGTQSLPSNEVTHQLAVVTPPTIALTAPLSGSSYVAPAVISLAANVTANGQTITKVQFYNGSTLLGEDATAPYGYTWSSVPIGSYNISARVVYGAGSTVTSATTSVVVTAAPSIVMTSPTSSAEYSAPATINFSASVVANGHTITKVQYFNGSVLLGEHTSAPYNFTWSSVSAGTYTLKARAVYDSGSTVDSAAQTIVVATLPPPWQTADIGAVGLTGSASHSNGAFTVRGAGQIAGTSDKFRFVYQPLSADGEIKAQLSSVQTSNTNGSFGVMIRETLSTGSKYAYMGVTQNLKFRWQRRSNTSGSTSSSTSTLSAPPNTWVRLVRSGSTITGYKSTDGVSWTKVSSRSISMAANVYAGFIVASGSTNALNTTVFSNSSVVP